MDYSSTDQCLQRSHFKSILQFWPQQIVHNPWVFCNGRKKVIRGLTFLSLAFPRSHYHCIYICSQNAHKQGITLRPRLIHLYIWASNFFFLVPRNYCVELSNARINRFSDGFFPSTSHLWNSLPSSVFPASFNLPSFKRQVYRHIRDQMAWFFLLHFLNIL